MVIVVGLVVVVVVLACPVVSEGTLTLPYGLHSPHMFAENSDEY